nr:hypothetical protein [Tanacetum cinerariifolium]
MLIKLLLMSLGLNLESELLKDLDELGTGNEKFSEVGADYGIPNEGEADINGNSNKESMNLDVAISIESVYVMHERFSNTVYGFFLGKRVAYLVVENYEGVCNIPVWVKFHDIHITAFTKDGLSAIAIKLSTPLMLDSYTSAMCTDSLGRPSYARAMVELRADVKLKDTLVVVVLKFVGGGYTMSTIHVEYEWTPPRCSSCKVFGHVLDECPKKIISDVLKNLKMPRKAVTGNGASSYGIKNQTGLDRQDVSTSNPFDALNTVEKNDEMGTNVGKSKLAEKGANSDVGEQLEESDDKLEELDDDIARYMSFTNRADEGANDAGLLEDEDFECYDG